MTVTPAHLAALRAALSADEETFDRLSTAPDFLDSGGFPILIAAAFVAATRRRFPPGSSAGDVVRFVGHLRASDERAREGLSATTAEQMLLGVLRGEPTGGQLDETTKGYAQISLLAELVRDLNEQELETLLAQAREQADEWLMHHSHR
jgi:hypothetical protein